MEHPAPFTAGVRVVADHGRALGDHGEQHVDRVEREQDDWFLAGDLDDQSGALRVDGVDAHAHRPRPEWQASRAEIVPGAVMATPQRAVHSRPLGLR
jgi:hypothetical protein